MSTLKIVFIAGGRQIVLYGQGMKQMWQVESHVLERLGEAERKELATARFRKYWVDEEGDRVEIMNDDDYQFFLRIERNKTPKIYFEAVHTTKEGQSEENQKSSTPIDTDNLNVHSTVECDVCLTLPIRGFRYKCLQCPNFDLCMKCESEMKHPDHLMLRIPNSESAKMETVCPITSIFGKSSRRQKKHAAHAAAAAGCASAEAPTSDGKSRHHRHHRRHCSGGAGLLSNFYDMMQDLADGGVIPQENRESPAKQTQQEPTAPPQAAAAATEAAFAAAKAAAMASAAATSAASSASSASATAGATAATNAASFSESNTTNETNKPTERCANEATTTPTGAIPVTPSLENLQNLIDPQFMKAGIQILNNFSEMFGKILDPTVTGNISGPASAASSGIDIDLTGENSAMATPPPTTAETPNKTPGSNEASKTGSGIITPMETETSVQGTTEVATESVQPRSRNSQSEENDWTMIDNNVPASSEATSAPVAAAVPLDFAKLSQQLQSHIENEMKAASISTSTPAASITPPQVAPSTPVIPPAVAPVAAPVVSAAPAPNVTESVERRAVAVFHPDPRINSAVHGMMAMGFSNEGAMLTQLLESVNGSIPLALDLMSAAQRN